MKSIYDALTDPDKLKVMGDYGWVNQKQKNDGMILLLTNGTFLFEKSVNKGTSHHWLGWQNSEFQAEKLRISGWLRFSEKPVPQDNFGMKVCNINHNDFMKSCEEGEWCYFTVVETCRSQDNDNNHVLLIFDGMKQAMSIHIFKLKMELLRCGKSVNISFISFIL